MSLVFELELGQAGPVTDPLAVEQGRVPLGMGDGMLGRSGEDQLTVAPDSGEVDRIALAPPLLDWSAEALG